ncbi:MAG: hypothetical protein K2F99_05480, partial [Muribaculaceae bacterium]|nr:hypothetical protein [Muribaculaceae bacterium]
MDSALIELGKSQFRAVTDQERDDEGFVILRPKADRVDQKMAVLTTSIDTLEDKLKELRKTQAQTKAYQDTDEYRAEKKASKKKGKKKARERLINMIFSNADNVKDAEEREASSGSKPEDAKDKDSKGKKKKGPRKEDTTLDTTYGQRFSPIVSMLNDSYEDFGRIAAEIEAELDSPSCRGKTMYRSTQTGNLLSAKNSQLSALKELGSIAKTLSDLEYKRDKEKKAEDGDTTKALSNLAAQYLRTTDDVGGKKSKGKKESRKEKAKGNFSKSAKSMGFTEPDDDDDEDSRP